MHLTWCMMMAVLALATAIYGSDCPEASARKVKNVDWVRCNEENQRRLEGIKEKSLDRNEQVNQMCCVLSDTITCWVDSLRSECGREAANELIRSSEFQGECSSWTYPESISKCHLWYTKWWFITIVAILAIVIIAAAVVVGLRKRARSTR